jgi:leucyl-tRNA synthetase
LSALLPEGDTVNTYDFGAIEAKWRAYWEDHQTFRTPNPGEPGFDAGRPKFYVLDMFPYPSGKGLHIGHPLGYIATDILARYKRMTGHQVLHPMGFDAFGLPAEQYAVEHNVHPRITTLGNIEIMIGQLKLLGLSYDWGREIRTMDPQYYRWTQWIFLQLYQSWVDPRSGRARPIAALLEDLEAGALRVGPDHALVVDRSVEEFGPGSDAARAWSQLDEAERRAVLDAHRLAYLAEVPVNWCPALGTVLANEEVTSEGRSERGNFPVYRRPLRQWMLRITAFAERLIADLDGIDWPEPVKLMQRNWIGKSTGARIDFRVAGHDAVIEVFTTRPDTLFGATYMVLAPEHPLVDALTTADRRAAVDAYRSATAARTEIDRQAEGRVKTGVFTGAHAINPANGAQIPIWTADYVLLGYGTGAIMAVPGHDSRDGAFARSFGLPIVPVVLPPDDWIAEQAALAGRAGGRDDYVAHAADYPSMFTGDGTGINSTRAAVSLDGLASPEARRAITAWLEAEGIGRAHVQYKLRDWLFSRQRYWGEPFPILHGPDGTIRPIDEAELPVELPDIDDFRPRGSDDPDAPPEPLLGRASEAWRKVVIDGVEYRRELNTMPNWAGSCWYYLRFIDPHNADALVDPDRERYWMAPGGVDLYVGGVEHAVLHLLYARFWHKALFDLGHVSTPEPFGRLYNQGYIQAYAYTDSRGVYVPADEVEERDGAFFHADQPVSREYGKMGKSLKNMVTPEAVIERYGCDTLRLYELYLGPFDQSKPWSTRHIVGISRFLSRVWRNFVDADSSALRVADTAPDATLLRLLHQTVRRVTEDIEGLRYNTAIAALIELNNALVGLDALPRAVAETFVLLLAPLAPHLAEELWQRLGHAGSLAYAPWPVYDQAYLTQDSVEIVVQVMNKVRGRIHVPADADRAAIEAAALADPSIQPYLAGKTVRKVVVVPGSLVNIVAN